MQAVASFLKVVFALLRKPVVIVGCVIVFLIFLPGLSKKHELLEKKELLREKSDSLVKENEALLNEIEKLESDPVYQEKIAREKLGFIKENEVILKLKPEQQ